MASLGKVLKVSGSFAARRGLSTSAVARSGRPNPWHVHEGEISLKFLLPNQNNQCLNEPSFYVKFGCLFFYRTKLCEKISSIRSIYSLTLYDSHKIGPKSQFRYLGPFLRPRLKLPYVRTPLLFDRRSINLSGAQEKEGHFHYKNFLRASE